MFTARSYLISIYSKVFLTKAQVTIRAYKLDDRIEKLVKEEAFQIEERGNDRFK